MKLVHLKKNGFGKPEIELSFSKMRNIIIILPFQNDFFWHPVYLAAGSTTKKNKTGHCHFSRHHLNLKLRTATERNLYVKHTNKRLINSSRHVT